jgi:hypothetical protein
MNHFSNGSGANINRKTVKIEIDQASSSRKSYLTGIGEGHISNFEKVTSSNKKPKI